MEVCDLSLGYTGHEKECPPAGMVMVDSTRIVDIGM